MNQIRIDINGSAEDWMDNVCEWYDPIEIEKLSCGDYLARRLTGNGLERIGKYDHRISSGYFVITKEMASNGVGTTESAA